MTMSVTIYFPAVTQGRWIGGGMSHRDACGCRHVHLDYGPVVLCGPVALYLLQWRWTRFDHWSLRSATNSFQWKAVCFLCCVPAAVSDRNVHAVATLELHTSLLKHSIERNDTWGIEVRGRLESCNDLVAEEALYHRTCYTRFTKKRDVGGSVEKAGRQRNDQVVKSGSSVLVHFNFRVSVNDLLHALCTCIGAVHVSRYCLRSTSPRA